MLGDPLDLTHSVAMNTTSRLTLTCIYRTPASLWIVHSGTVGVQSLSLPTNGYRVGYRGDPAAIQALTVSSRAM